MYAPHIAKNGSKQTCRITKQLGIDWVAFQLKSESKYDTTLIRDQNKC